MNLNRVLPSKTVTGVTPRVTKMSDPLTVVAGISAVKTTFDALRSAIGLIRDTKGLLPKDEKTAVIAAALATAESSSKVAEAEVAKALGYELCRAHFPPVVMLQVGYHIGNADAFSRTGNPVFECPECHRNSAGPYSFQRI
jgi:hypothetical protein